MDRTKVPMHHDMKKPFFVALRDAWFIFEPNELEAVKAVQRAKGKTDEEIEIHMYYHFDYWRQRVRRVVPPPAIHYRRVRAVYATFGTLVDAKSGKPLFNETAWKKAQGVLDDILAGYAADLPDVAYYHQRLDKKGNPAVDEDGLPLLDCLRGTNDTELVHKLLNGTFSGWVAGIEMSDYLLAEFRHRYNHNMSERRRLGFPKVRHSHATARAALAHRCSDCPASSLRADSLPCPLLPSARSGTTTHGSLTRCSCLLRPTMACCCTLSGATPAATSQRERVLAPCSSTPRSCTPPSRRSAWT